MKKYTTILFDLDGTLIDTNELIIRTFQYIFPDKSRDDVLQYLGPTLRQTFSQTHPDQVDEMIEKYVSWNLSHHDELVEPFPYLTETLAYLQQQGIKLAIVTSKLKKSAMKGIELFNLTSYFDELLFLDDVTEAKPHPEQLLLAMKRLGVEDKSQVLMVGDNVSDIQAGHAAGVDTVLVAWTAKNLEQVKHASQPTYVIDTLKDLKNYI